MITQTVLVHREHQWRYIPIPKVASTSILRALSGGFYPPGRGAAPNGTQMMTRDITFRSPVFRNIIFVRNPFDRLVSLYRNRGHRHGGNYVNKSHRGFRLRYGLDGDESFDTFVKKIFAADNVDPHFEQQWKYVAGVPGVSRIGRFEWISKDLTELWEWIYPHYPRAPRPALPREAASPPTDRHYSTWYSKKRTVELVADFYKRDCEEFNYFFEDKR